jgi:hypothetical protein
LRKCRYFAAAVDPCGGKFKSHGPKSTCSKKCERRRINERKRGYNQKKAEKRPPLTCDTPGCDEQFPAYKNSRFCPKHRGDYDQPHHKENRRAAATGRYWKDPKTARANSNAKAIATRAKDPKTARAKKKAAYDAAVAENPQKVREHKSYRRRVVKDPKKVRADGLANYYKHADKINAKDRAEYGVDLELSRAKGRAKQKSRKVRHPRRVRALQKAKDERRRDRISRERGW